jgi:hypothetical protein
MQRTTVEDVQITLGPLGLKDRVKGIKLVARTFAHLGPEKQIVRALFLTDESLSLALRRKGELVGVYLPVSTTCGRTSSPTPCSPVKHPPTSTQSFSISLPASSARGITPR